MKPLYLALLLLVIAEPPKVTTVRIPVHPHDLQICAPYTSTVFPREMQWSCQDAATVARWLLANGRPGDECAE